MINKQTFTYKIVEDCAIRADVYRGIDSKACPVIVFIHGGGLIGGRRDDPLIIIEMLSNAGYTVVSIDYRLAPETKLKNIIEDIHDAIVWVREKGQELFNIDPNRMGVVGNSAGGYLTLLSGFIIDPPPKALVAFYGYGDIDGSWYCKPSPFYCGKPLVTESTARAAVGTRMISEISSPNNRMLFYLYCRQNGCWPREVTGYDPEIEPDKFDRFCPIRNITTQYPPTLLLHGDKDTDVPYEQSVAMAKKLEEIGVKHQLITVLGKGHGFEGAGFTDPVVAHALNAVLVFLKQYV
jgi:acetyl esterase/lipase